MPARLHHEQVATGAPPQWLMMTHGIYGTGGNWRSIARKIVQRRPEWGVVLVDLRHHGRSEAGAPPHTLDACAGDLLALRDELAAAGTLVRAVAGHSFGGKVVLALRATRPAWLAQTWVLDSTPRARPDTWDAPGNTVRAVWDSMCALDVAWPRRDDYVAALEARGHPRSLAQWIAMNLEPDASGSFRNRLDLDALRAMMVDYHARDLWSAIEDPSLPGDLHVVIAGRSNTVSAEDRARLAAEPAAYRAHTDVIATADHWLNADAPDEVVALIATGLPPG
jgi:esterase